MEKWLRTSCWAVNHVPRLSCAFFYFTFLLLCLVMGCWPIRIKQVNVEKSPCKTKLKEKVENELAELERYSHRGTHRYFMGVMVMVKTLQQCVKMTLEDYLALTCHSLIHMTIPSLASGTRVQTGVLLGSSIILICREHMAIRS